MALVKLTIAWYEKVLGGKLEGYQEVTRDKDDVFLEREPEAPPKTQVAAPKVESAPDGATATAAPAKKTAPKPKATKKKSKSKPKAEPKDKNAAAKRSAREALTGDKTNASLPKTAQNG